MKWKRTLLYFAFLFVFSCSIAHPVSGDATTSDLSILGKDVSARATTYEQSNIDTSLNVTGRFGCSGGPFPRVSLELCHRVLASMSSNTQGHSWDQPEDWVATHTMNPLLHWSTSQNECLIELLVDVNIPPKLKVRGRFSLKEVWTAATEVVNHCAVQRRAGLGIIESSEMFVVAVGFEEAGDATVVEKEQVD